MSGVKDRRSKWRVVRLLRQPKQLVHNSLPHELLVTKAREARQFSHSPYSGFAVGAALQTSSGAIFAGSNIENISFGLTICAERAAVCAAVVAGETEFAAIAIVADAAEPPLPCGACRQVLAEFSPSLQIVSATIDGKVQEAQLSDLLPRPRQGILDKP